MVADPIKFERLRSKSVLEDAIRLLPAYVTAGVSGYAAGGPVGALTAMFAKMGL